MSFNFELSSEFIQYIESSFYKNDLLATRELWQSPKVLGTAGIFIFLSYISIPNLIIVQSASSEARAITMKLGLESEREKRFLQGIIGVGTQGIKDKKVQKSIIELGQHHRQFMGMRNEYMDYISSIIALSVLRVYASKNISISQESRASYWRYIGYAVSLLGTELKNELDAQSFCENFINKYTQSSEQGKSMLKALIEIYGEYILPAVEIAFPATQVTIRSMLNE